MNNAPIGIFDSGIGGITVLDACRALLENENFIYVSDPKFMPYGLKSESEIFARVEACVNELTKHGCKAFVAACNTATNVGIARLRQCRDELFVGLEPALKPAKKACGDGRIVLLCTEATFKQQKFKDLLQRCGEKNVIVLPQKDLAQQIESAIGDTEKLRALARATLLPLGKMDGLVLGCTHYVFLRPYIHEICGNQVKVFDGNAGAAAQLQTLLQKADALSSQTCRGSVLFVTL